MKRYLLFLHGQYNAADISFYKKLCTGRKLVAVDGGYAFFKKSGIVPHLLIGDFDSLKRIPKNLSRKTLVIQHPVMKDRTDVELAVDHCLEQGAEEIDIVQPSFGEPDQFVGNMMLPALYACHKRNPSCVGISIINRNYEACAVGDGRYGIKGHKGDMVSLVPLTDQIKVSWSGTEYDIKDEEIRRGASRGLRNRLAGSRAVIRITGLALLIHQVRVSRLQ
jgi:thiamine pyrophosphokinase